MPYNDSDIQGLLGSFTQAGTGGINLETGKAITGANIPSAFQNLSNMNMGIVGQGATPAPNTVSTGSASDQFFNSANSSIAPRLASVMPNANNPQNAMFQQLLQQLLGSFTKQNSGQQDAYQKLLATLTGKGGLAQQLSDATKNYGAGQQELLAESAKQQKGQLGQDLTSRGLGNTTIRNSLMAGLNRNQNIAEQNLASNIAQQKMSTIPTQANIQEQAFNMNPFNAQQGTYLNLLTQLGGSMGGMGRGTSRLNSQG